MTETTSRIIAAIKAVPFGTVSSYRDIALAAGIPGGARQVVRILHSMSRSENLPWHRIIKADGQIAFPPGEARDLQIALLRSEGVVYPTGGFTPAPPSGGLNPPNPPVSLKSYFDALGGPCITVIGSGGKTSLIKHLAQQRRGMKTLVTTTTKMALPSPEAGWYDYFWDNQIPSPGITLAGVPDPGAGKLGSLPLDLLAGLIPRFEYVLIEGDGSRTLPLKAWADYEPVVPPETSITVGILPLWTLGMVISEKIIHRLPLFTALTQGKPGEILSLRHLVSVITAEQGLFSAAQGKKMLFFNQVESDRALEQAQELTALLPKGFLDGIIAGSVQQDQITILYNGGFGGSGPPDGGAGVKPPL